MRRTARLKTHRLLGLVSLLISLLISGCVTTVITPPVAYKAALEPTTQNHSELKTRALDKKSRVNAASGKLQRTAKVPSGHGGKWGSACVGSWYINKEHDPATKWSYHGARWMAPQLARWLTPDPPVKVPDGDFLLSPWDLNPYQYGRSNPVVFWDPDGRVNNHNFEMVKASPQVRNSEVTQEQQRTGIANAQGMVDEAVDTAKGMVPTPKDAVAASFGPLGVAVSSTAGMSDEIGAMIDSYFEIKDIVNNWDTYTPEERAYYAGRIQGAVMANAALGVIFKKSFQRLKINPCPIGNSFLEGTLVLTKDGLVPIEEVREGDLVWSRDEATGETGWRAVELVVGSAGIPYLEIALDGEASAREILQVTQQHPIWVLDKGWVDAGEIAVGDEIFTSSGIRLRVSSSVWAQSVGDVYNFSVHQFHSYFVGDNGVWVHNCPPRAADRSGKDFTPAGKREVIERNMSQNDGNIVCEDCGVETVPPKKSASGVTPPKNEWQIDHVKPKSKGGAGSPDNGQVLCRDCNRRKWDK